MYQISSGTPVQIRPQVIPLRTYFFQPNNLLMKGPNKINKRYDEEPLDTKDGFEAFEKPREKMLALGAQVLSVPELLAVLLNVGTKKESILEMTNRILREYGEKNIINEKDPKNLKKELDIPELKACQLVACFELGRRFFKTRSGGPVIIRTAEDVFEYLKDMRDLPKEQFRGLYLNSQYRLIHDEVISIGSLTANITHPREVFKPAVEYSAAAVIVAHNHPSGSIRPTASDLKTTEQLIKAGKIFGIDLLDHVIIAGDKYASVPADYSPFKSYL